MKKDLLYLFSLLLSMSLFVACGSDDDDDDTPKPPVVDESWKELSKTYEGTAQTLTLKLNDTDYSFIAGKSVEVNATSAEAATVVLKNLLPDDKAITINATLKKGDADLYSFTGEATVNKTELKVSGNFSADKKLALNVTRKNTSALAGNWAMPFYVSETEPLTVTVPVLWKATTGDPVTDAMLGAFGPVLSGLIPSKVEEVNVFLKENGTFDVNWKTLGATENTSMPPFVSAMIGGIYYTVTDKQLFIALDKNVMSLLEMLPSETPLPVDVEQIVALLTDMGGFLGLPINYVEADGLTTFYLTEGTVLPVLQMLSPMIAEGLDESMRPMVEALLQALSAAKEVELGLSFQKK